MSSHYFKNHIEMTKSVCKNKTKLFTKEKNCINGFINHYYFWFFHSQHFFSLREVFFLCCGNFPFAWRIFLSLWEFFFCSKSFSFVVRTFQFVVRIFLLQQKFLICCENFSFVLRIFLQLWDFFFPCENFFSWKFF